jgi:hypothetical protein
MAKRVSDKSPRDWQVASVWIKRRDGPERVLNAYRLLLGLPPRRAGQAGNRLEFLPREVRAGVAEHVATPFGPPPSEPRE